MHSIITDPDFLQLDEKYLKNRIYLNITGNSFKNLNYFQYDFYLNELGDIARVHREDLKNIGHIVDIFGSFPRTITYIIGNNITNTYYYYYSNSKNFSNSPKENQKDKYDYCVRKSLIP